MSHPKHSALDIFLLVGYIVTSTIPFGFFLALILIYLPIFQNWIVYLLWGPTLSTLCAWAFSEIRDVGTGVARHSIWIVLLAGTTHLTTATAIWLMITHRDALIQAISQW